MARKGEALPWITPALAIDPSVRNVGIAFWSSENTLKPDVTAVLRGPSGTGWMDSLWVIVQAYRSFLRENVPRATYIEWPAVWTGSAKSMSGATSGDLGKLWTSVGALMAATRITVPDVRMFPVPVNDWKGQLSKKAVLSRISRIIGNDYRDHEGDAVGIGLALQGML